MEGRVTVGFVTLDAGTRSTLLADVTGEFPASRGNVLDAVNGLQEDRVGKAHLKTGSRAQMTASLTYNKINPHVLITLRVLVATGRIYH